MERDVAGVPGVAEVQPVRMPRIQFHGLPVMLVSADLAKVSRRVKRHMIAGDEAAMNRLSSEGKGVILSENLSALTKIRLGDTVVLPAPAETLRLSVERFGPPGGDQRALLDDSARRRRARLREAVRQARAAAGPDAALRVLAADPDSRVPERRAVLTPFE